MLVADLAVSSVFVFAVFAGSWPGLLIGVLVVSAGLAATIVTVSRVITGRRRVLGAVTVTVTLAAVGAYAVLNGILAPMTAQQDWSLHLLACTLAAGVLGLFLGPWPLRIIGAVAAAGLITVITVLPTSAERAATQYAESQIQEAQDRVERFRSDGTHPIVTELEGWSNARVRATGGDAMTWMVSDEGAVADVLVTGHVDENAMDPIAPCTWISHPGDTEVPAPGALPSWCVKTETGWVRTDGTGFAVVRDSTLIALNPSDEFGVRDAGGTRAATAQEVAALATSLRPMTEAEVETWILPSYGREDSPAVLTPGL